MYGSFKAGLQYMNIHTIDNHTIKYESQSLVVDEGVNLLVLVIITGNLFADLRRSVGLIDRSRMSGIK